MKLVLIFVFTAILSCFGAGDKDTVVYKETFDKKPGKEWSTDKLSLTPVDYRQFLGSFGEEAVALTLKDLPAHKFIRIQFELVLAM